MSLHRPTVTLVKLGGSLITDKQRESHFRADVMARLADEIAAARREQPALRLVVGHGSGSFGHVAAKRHGTAAGVQTPDEWRGFAEVATVAGELTTLVARLLHAAGVPAWRLSPSASALARDGVLEMLALHPVVQALAHGLVPLVHGDVALDTVRGGTIVSTETVFTYLVRALPAADPSYTVSDVLLLGEVSGVYGTDGQVIPRISPDNYAEIAGVLGGSVGTDVTGGMETKVADMLALVEAQPSLRIRIVNGLTPGLLRDALLGLPVVGTQIRAD